MKQSQEKFVINQLKLNGFISRNFCLENYVSRLGAIICDLKKDGWDFDAKYVTGKKGKNFVYYVTKTPLKQQTFSVQGLDKTITILK